MARRPTSKGVLLFLFALLASACSSDLFHSTEWETRCAKNPSAAGCGQGGDGGSGGSAPGACVSCLDLAGASTPPPPTPESVCLGSRDTYDLLNNCRCLDPGACATSCMTAPACGGDASPPDLVDCEACMVAKCGGYIEACAASGP